MTVADLSPVDLFGIIVLAIMTTTLGMKLIRFSGEWGAHLTTRQKPLYWGGVVALLGIPTLVGVIALQPWNAPATAEAHRTDPPSGSYRVLSVGPSTQ